MKEFVLSMKSISKSYKNTPVLQDIHMDIPRGTIYGLVGSNGAGKSTLMRIIAGQTKSDGGTLSLFGIPSDTRNTRARRRVGTLIEDPGFFLNMSARENLEYFRIQFGVPGRQRVDEILEMTGLQDCGKKKYKNFSMGMKHRLGLGLALLHAPELLILDEPINGLDPEGIHQMRSLLIDLNQNQNTTILISSHILPELENIATEYGFLSHGKLVEQISAEELKKKCTAYIDLEVGDVTQMCVLLEKELQITDYQIHPQGHIHIFHAVDCGEEISRTAILKGIPLKSLTSHTVSLENYYMNLMGGKNYD